MTRPRVALLTGRSDPARTGLPGTQAGFLAAVTPAGAEAIPDGYPWIGGPTERPVPLILAMWRNAAQWRAARSAPTRAAVAARIGTLGDGPLAFITASCGLDLLAAGWTGGAACLVIALGPVTSQRPAWPGARLVTVVGRRDLLSRTVHRVPADICVPCGHMGYWRCPDTRHAVAAILSDWAP